MKKNDSKTRRSKIAALGAAALLIALAFPATSFADNPSGCDFAASGTTESMSAAADRAAPSRAPMATS